jgi:hypothetical protein
MRLRSVIFLLAACYFPAIGYTQVKYNVFEKDKTIDIVSGSFHYRFSGDFMIIYNKANPGLALRPAGIEGVSYNVPTWKTFSGKTSDLRHTQTGASVAGDGFDDKVLHSNQSDRTVRMQNAGETVNVTPVRLVKKTDTVFFEYRDEKLFRFKARIVFNKEGYPSLQFTIQPRVSGYFSVGYTGAPSFLPSTVPEIWQPLIWQEKRFPDNSYLTMAFRAPLPTTLVFDGNNTLGVLAAPSEFPFEQLPLMNNSRFGIALRNNLGKAQPQIFAPVLGGMGSLMKNGDSFRFKSYLVIELKDITHTYEKIARSLYGFRDYRHNDISSLNSTLDEISKYALSSYAWFIDSLKGCAYSTDVPGAVKNVSSLNPLELAVVMDDDTMFEKRAYPIMEYMLSREKLLFSLDSTQKIQSPSRKMNGPVAPLSELVSLYDVFGKDQGFLLKLAREEFNKTRIRNLEIAQKGNTWMNAMYLYKATGDTQYLKLAKAGADDYIEKRVKKGSFAFRDQYVGSMFFWPSFTSRWVELLELYELTHDKKYLDAAHAGARQYSMFAWMSPAIPDSNILVNPEGKAPMYWYMKEKGHHQMYSPEEWAPAWRLSAIGLTPESSGTSSGHRAIFMANYAPWMLRIGYYSKDTFLMNVAKAAIIGRYRNFPGYHINTARTTAYEKKDFPYHQFMDQSVTSFHFNHILPMASMLIDYLISDVFVKSEGAISFPSEYMEGYAYLKNNFYGSRPGKWYGEDSINLWMPSGLLKLSNVELNYIAGRKANQLFIAFTNQSSQPITCNVKWRSDLIKLSGTSATIDYWQDNHFTREQNFPAYSDSWPVQVSAHGITVVRISGVDMNVRFQDQLVQREQPWYGDYNEMDFGHAHSMIFNLGGLGKRAYIWLGDDDTIFKNVAMTYWDQQGKKSVITDSSYPFEFTVPLNTTQKEFQFRLSGEWVNGKQVQGEIITMKAKAK